VVGGVFICHASSDAGTAQRIVAVLERAGVRCWIAPRDIEPGEEYTQAILDGLEAAPAVVLVFSAATNESPHVRRELETTVGSDTRIIPVRLEPVEPARSLRYFIGTAQWLDTVDVPREQWEQALVRGVQRALGGGEAAAAAAETARPGPEPTAGNDSPIRRWLVPVAAALAVALTAAVVGFVATRGDEDPSNPDAGSQPSESADGSPTDSTSASPTTKDSPSSSPPPAPSEVVFEESFDEEPHAFRTDTEQFDPGSISGDVVDGEYVVTVEGIPEGNKGWFTVSFTRLSGDWSISVEATSRPKSGGCGLVINSGGHTLTAVLRRAAGDGELMWFVDNVYEDDVLYQAEAGASGAFSISRRGDALVVQVGRDQVAEVPVKSLGRPNTAGVAVVGAAGTCIFDDFRVVQAG
jgi:TIR domain